jgi:hypothetical protein
VGWLLALGLSGPNLAYFSSLQMKLFLDFKG